MSGTSAGDFKPNVLVFCCNWCAYAGADLAGVSRLKITPHFRVVRTMCSGRVDPELILEAFANGVDGVMVAGCHPGDCHYISGNMKALRRSFLLERLLTELGVEKGRFRLEWIAASESPRYAEVINQMSEDIRRLGPFAAPEDKEQPSLEASASG